MEQSVLAKSIHSLTAITASLKELSFSNKLVIPEILVAGNKCAGKSSLIEKLIGFEYLPREYNTDTQRIQFHFIYTPHLILPEAQIVETISKGSIIRYVDFDKLRDRINKLTVPQWANDEDSPIIINIYSPFIPNLTIIDLPGYSRIFMSSPPKAKQGLTRDMIMNQIAKPNSIILGVFSANADLAGYCDVLTKMRQCDPKGFRTLAGVTKIDIMDRGTNSLSILKNQEIPLRNGYVGIINRPSQNRKGTSIEQALVEEENFFKSHNTYKDLPAQFWGTESLSLKLVEVIYEQTMKQLISITKQLKQKKAAIKAKLQDQQNFGIFFLPDHITKKTIAELMIYANQLQSLQKLIEEGPLFAKILKNHQQSPQNYNEISERLKPVEIMRPRKNDPFDFLFKTPIVPPAPTHPPKPPKITIYANSQQREANERKKKMTFQNLFGI